MYNLISPWVTPISIVLPVFDISKTTRILRAILVWYMKNNNSLGNIKFHENQTFSSRDMAIFLFNRSLRHAIF